MTPSEEYQKEMQDYFNGKTSEEKVEILVAFIKYLEPFINRCVGGGCPEHFWEWMRNKK